MEEDADFLKPMLQLIVQEVMEAESIEGRDSAEGSPWGGTQRRQMIDAHVAEKGERSVE